LDADVERAGEVRLQLLRAPERRELRDGAEAPIADREVRARPEHAEAELRHQHEELGRELLRRKLDAAGALAPELLRDFHAARQQIVRHVASPLDVEFVQRIVSTILPKCSDAFIERCASAARSSGRTAWMMGFNRPAASERPKRSRNALT